MPVALNSQLGSKEQADAQLAQAIMSAMRVSMPGIIQSFDPDAVTAVGKRAARTVLTGMCYSVGSATRQGSSSLTRFIGQSAITSSTWRR